MGGSSAIFQHHAGKRVYNSGECKMSVKHKWHKEIKAWADGAEIEQKQITVNKWVEFDGDWLVSDCWEYRIKPQPKPAQYLYVWKDNIGTIEISKTKPNPLQHYASNNWKCLGKIKLEVDDE